VGSGSVSEDLQREDLQREDLQREDLQRENLQRENLQHIERLNFSPPRRRTSPAR
jgi:uncharacterized protein YjbI with pentapeptide repeats